MPPHLGDPFSLSFSVLGYLAAAELLRHELGAFACVRRFSLCKARFFDFRE